jgi:hypothetical protein
MNIKSTFKATLVALLALNLALPLSAHDKKKKDGQRGVLEKMEAVPCGAKETGLAGLGAMWGSAGITHINSNEKLCPQYLLRTDDMDYEIRPLDLKHATILPIGKEGEFRIRKNEMTLTMTEGSDLKPRDYEVVAMNPANPDNAGPKPLSSSAPDVAPKPSNPSGSGSDNNGH